MGSEQGMAVLKILTERQEHKALKDTVLEYLSEMDNPVPCSANRRSLRNKLRKLVGAPAEPPPRRS
jgi:hypothetical protein